MKKAKVIHISDSQGSDGIVLGESYEILEEHLTGNATIIDGDDQVNLLFANEYEVVEE